MAINLTVNTQQTEPEMTKDLLFDSHLELEKNERLETETMVDFAKATSTRQIDSPVKSQHPSIDEILFTITKKTDTHQ